MNGFRVTCICCRSRRRYLGKFSDPKYWIEYTYKSNIIEEYVTQFVKDGLLFSLRNGGKIKVTLFDTLRIDPRGHFTSLRCAIIIVLDNIMLLIGHKKPLPEFCEFLANYPTW